MITILTTSQAEHDTMAEILKALDQSVPELNILNITLVEPGDNLAETRWTVDNVRHHFPEGTPDEVIIEGFSLIESDVIDAMDAEAASVIQDMAEEMTYPARCIECGDLIKPEVKGVKANYKDRICPDCITVMDMEKEE